MRRSGFIFAPDGFAAGSSPRLARPKAERFDRVRGRLADAVLAHLPLAVAVIDAEVTLLFWNAQAATLWGMPPLLAAEHPPLAQAVAAMAVLSEQQKQQILAFCADMVARGDRVEPDTWLRIGAGRDCRLAIQVRGLGHGRWMLMLNDGRGLGDVRKGLAGIGDVASMDALTGLANRRHLERVIGTRGAAQSDATGGASSGHAAVVPPGAPAIGLLLIDVAGMQAINDEAGRAAGDALLTLIARRLEHELREDDLLARYAGDDFAILIPNGATASTLAERLLRNLARPFLVESRTLEVNFNIGIASATADAHAHETLLRRASAALQTARAAGPNEFVLDAAITAPAATSKGATKKS